MNMALARYLKDFSQPEPVETFPAPETSGDFPDFPALPAIEASVDLEAACAKARSEGYEEARRDLENVHRDALATAEIAHQQELAELRRIYETEIAGHVAGTVSRFAEAIAGSVSETVAAILAPLVSERLAAKAVETLAQMLRQAILDGAAGQITVRGPKHLYDRLTEEVGPEAGIIRHVETEDLDLTVELDGSVLVTRVSAWTASLKKVLE